MTTNGKEQQHYGRYAAAQASAIHDQRLSHAEFRVLMELSLYSDGKTGKCYPKELSVALNLGMTQGRLSRHVTRLVALGYVRYTRERVEGLSHTRNVYYVDGNAGYNLPPANKHITSGNMKHITSGNIDAPQEAKHITSGNITSGNITSGNGINNLKNKLTPLSASVSALPSVVIRDKQASPPKKKSTEQRAADREWHDQKRQQVDLGWLERQRQEDEAGRVAKHKELQAKLATFDSRNSFRQRMLDRRAAAREARKEGAAQ